MIFGAASLLCVGVLIFGLIQVGQQVSDGLSAAVGAAQQIQAGAASGQSSIESMRLVDNSETQATGTDWLALTLAEGRQLQVSFIDQRGNLRCSLAETRDLTSYMRWSHSGDQVVLVTGDIEKNSDLILVSLDGEQRTLTDGSRNYMPAWSRDDHRIAFVSERTGSRQIYVLELASDELLQITEGNLSVSNPAWGADNTLYFVEERGQDFMIVNYDLVTGQKKDIVAGDFPSISPDGNRLLYVKRDLRNQIPQDLYVYDISSGHSTLLVSNGGDQRYPTWSPDGEQILYLTIFVNRIYLYGANSDGSNQEELIRDYPLQLYPLDWRVISEVQVSMLDELTACTGRRPEHETVVEPIQPEWDLPEGWWVFPSYMPARDLTGRPADIITLSGPIWNFSNSYYGLQGKSGQIAIVMADPLLTAEIGEIRFDQEPDLIDVLSDLVRIFYRGQTLKYITDNPQIEQRFGREVVIWQFDSDFAAVTTLLLQSSDDTWFYLSVNSIFGEHERALEEAAPLLASFDFPIPETPKPGTPEYTVMSYINATAQGDVDAALEVSCLGARALNEAALTIAGPIGDFATGAIEFAVQASDLDVSNFRYQVVNVAGNRAHVRIGGNMLLRNMESGEREIWPYWQYVGRGRDYVLVVYELGEWRICS